MVHPENRNKRPKTILELIGQVPPAERPPEAWYMTLDEDCIKGYEQWKVDYKAWADRVAELIQMSGLKPTSVIRYGGLGGRVLEGFEPSTPLASPPRWWRGNKSGYWVPRKRTKAEREGEVLHRFHKVQAIPHAIDYLKGMPTALYLPKMSAVLPVVRRPGEAVLVFLSANPDHAVQPFEPDNRWSRLKLSTYHQIRENYESTANH